MIEPFARSQMTQHFSDIQGQLFRVKVSLGIHLGSYLYSNTLENMIWGTRTSIFLLFHIGNAHDKQTQACVYGASERFNGCRGNVNAQGYLPENFPIIHLTAYHDPVFKSP